MANQKQELTVVAMFVNGSRQNQQFYRGPSIDASYQVSVHLAEGVSEEKIKMWKVNGRQTPSDGKSSYCIWQGELKRWPFNADDCMGRFNCTAKLFPLRKATPHVRPLFHWRRADLVSSWLLYTTMTWVNGRGRPEVITNWL